MHAHPKRLGVSFYDFVYVHSTYGVVYNKKQEQKSKSICVTPSGKKRLACKRGKEVESEEQ